MLTSDTPIPELSWVSIARWVYAQRRSAVLVGIGVALLGALLAVVLPASWTSEALFMPQAQRGASALGGIAAQLGVDVPASEPSQSPHFYVELLRSPQFLKRADGRYPTRAGDSVALADLLRVTGKDSSARVARVGVKLVSRIAVFVAPRTGVITAAVTVSDPVAAQAILHRLLDLLDEFNVETRRSRGGAERRFTEGRVQELRAELRAAEDTLERFLRGNRITQFSPELTFQRDRLTREVTMRAQVFAMMMQSYEQARIEEVRDTPVLSRLTGPTLPFRKSGPSPVRFAATGFLLGALGLLALRLGAPLVAQFRRA